MARNDAFTDFVSPHCRGMGIRWISVPTGMSVKIWSKSSDLVMTKTGEIQPPGMGVSTTLGPGNHVGLWRELCQFTWYGQPMSHNTYKQEEAFDDAWYERPRFSPNKNLFCDLDWPLEAATVLSTDLSRGPPGIFANMYRAPVHRAPVGSCARGGAMHSIL